MKINLIYFFICVSISLGTSEVVNVSNFSFSPDHLEIDIGETVTWTRISGSLNVDGSTATFANNPDSHILYFQFS